ncbi:MAG: type III pantothenate kinase [Planctomycetota bacterium]
MNIIAVDIGNTNITIGLFVNDKQESIATIPGDSTEKLIEVLQSAWNKIPILKAAKDKKRDGVLVGSSVKSSWTSKVRQLIKQHLGEKIYMIGEDIPLPMEVAVDEPERVGVDRVVSAAAAYAVVEDAVVVADFGTAVTIDLVDEKGVFLGGVIMPGFEISAQVLKDNTAQLPEVKVHKPDNPYGTNTSDAINCGLYYSAIGAMEFIVRQYAEKIGKWPQTVIAGGNAELIKDDCKFIDGCVPDLVVKGIVLAYKKYLEDQQA